MKRRRITKPKPAIKPTRRPYTMSEAALEQRRAAQPAALAAGALGGKATGPRTEDGKAASCRNNWKHGMYSAVNRATFNRGAASITKLFGKPCVTTCPFHPDNPNRNEAPCSLVLDGLTHAGGSCLDKTVYVSALQSLMNAMQTGDMEGMHGVLANELAANLQVVDSIRQAVAEHGVMVTVYAVDSDGKLERDENDKPIPLDVKLNPALIMLVKFTEAHGVNFAELMATPRARERVKDDDEAASGLAALLGGVLSRMKGGPRTPRTIEHDDA